ncbi:MAG: pilus assembly PilX N-terminal domain-containing protein, partial [Ectothiorhodospiraceae bacterium]
MNRIRNQRGAVAIIAVVMLLVFAVGGATIATLTSTGARTGAEHRQGVQALYLAETALEWAANRLAQAPDDDFDEACNNLAGEELAIGQSGATGARIAEAGIDGDDCELLILAGAPSLSGTETDSRRRLEVAVGRNVGNPGGGGGNPVADPGNWSGKTCKGSQSCSNGSITFSAGKGPYQR